MSPSRSEMDPALFKAAMSFHDPGKTMKVYQAIGKVGALLSQSGITKDRKNTQQGYNFRGIDDVLNALSSALVEAGLVILPRCTERIVVERETSKGGAIFNVTCRVEFDLVSTEDGSTHTVATFGEAMDTADKATNKAMSAAYKYLALLVFCIPTEASPDTDADYTTHSVRAKKDPIQALANVIIEKFDNGNEWGAFEEYVTITDNDDKLALWSILKPRSEIRSALKRLGEEQRKKDAELQNMTDGSDPALIAQLQQSIEQTKKVAT